MAEKNFAIRLSAKGTEEVRAALKGMGADGATALRQLDQASAKATPGLKAVDKAAGDVRKEFESLAGRIPVIGGALQAIGPAGIAAGAGIGIAAFALKGLWDAGQKAREELDRIKTASDNTGLSIRGLQVLETFAIENDIDDIASIMVKLEKATSDAARGTGELYGKLKALHPEILKQLIDAKTQEERWNTLQVAIAATSDRLGKVAIATAAFGEKGAQVIRNIGEQGAAIDVLGERYTALGLIMSDDVVKAVSEMDTALDLLESKQKARDARLGIAFLPLIEWWENKKGSFQDTLSEVGEELKPIGERSAYYLKDQLSQMEKSAEGYASRIQDILSGASGNLESHERLYRNVMASIALIEGELSARKPVVRSAFGLESEYLNRARNGSPAPAAAGFQDPAELAKKAAEAAKLQADAARDAANAQREAQAIEKQTIALRQELGDWTGVYAAKQAELNALVGQYGITQEMVNASLAKFQSGLDGSAAFATKTAAALDSIKTPAERATEELAAYTAEAVRLGQSTLPEVIAAIRAKTDALNVLTDAEEAAAFMQSTLGLKLQAVADAMKGATAANREAVDANFELELSLNTMDGIYRGQIRTLGDLKNVALDTFYRISVSAIEAAAKVKGSSLTDIFSAVAGAFNFGGASPGKSGSGSGLTGIAQNIGNGMAGVKVHHDGRVIGDPMAATRLVPISMFRNAPRHHTGLDPSLRPGERAIIAEDGERMFSRMDNARIVRAVERGGSGGNAKLEVNIHPPAGYQAESKETRSSGGGRGLEVTFTKMLNDVIGSGGANKSMRAQFGIKPQVAG